MQTEIIQELKNCVVLAELGGYGNGTYCAKYGSDIALSMMGTYIIAPCDEVPYPKDFVFKPDPSIYVPYLREQVAVGHSGRSKIGVSVASVKLAHTIDFLTAAEEAGADYVSLCAHSTMDMFVREKLGEEMCKRENTAILKEWATAIVDAVNVPVIFKIGLTEPEDTINTVDILADIGVPIVHINLKITDDESDGLRFIKRLVGRCQCLIAGGGIKNVNDAKRVLDNGTDAVAIGTAAMKDPELCRTIQKNITQ